MAVTKTSPSSSVPNSKDEAGLAAGRQSAEIIANMVALSLEYNNIKTIITA
jgi:hypothetical protein